MVFTLIDSQAGLDRMISHIAREKVIAFDIECASNLYHYVNRVCLMQFFAGGEAFVVDALAPIDLGSIGRILENPDIEIVMHDTDFDMRSLDHDYGWRPRNLFDTLIAARLCGRKEFGLGKLLELHFDIHGSKRFQRADWTIRPLPLNMLEYAASDVTDLLRLRDLLASEIEQLGRTPWLKAEFLICEETKFIPDERPLFARVKKVHELCNGRELAVLSELAELRNEIAQKLDLPLFKVVDDQTLIAIAKQSPRTIDSLLTHRGIHPICRRDYAEQILNAVQIGLAAPEIRWPRSERGKEYPLETFNALKRWRTAYAATLGVDPDIVISMRSLRHLARGESIDTVLLREPISAWRGEEIKHDLILLLNL